LRRKGRNGVFGDHQEIQAASELYCRKVLVYTEVREAGRRGRTRMVNVMIYIK